MKRQPKPQPANLSTREVSERLAVHVNTLRKLLTAGAFPGAFRLGKDFRIPESDVDAFIAQRRLVPSETAA